MNALAPISGSTVMRAAWAKMPEMSRGCVVCVLWIQFLLFRNNVSLVLRVQVRNIDKDGHGELWGRYAPRCVCADNARIEITRSRPAGAVGSIPRHLAQRVEPRLLFKVRIIIPPSCGTWLLRELFMTNKSKCRVATSIRAALVSLHRACPLPLLLLSTTW